MRYKHPSHPHTFAHYDEHELHGKTFEQMNHLMYVDRVLSDPRHNLIDPMDLECMTDEQLRDMLGADVEVVKKPKPAKLPNPYPSAPPPERPRYTAPRTISPLRYKATVWEKGRSVSLGWFMTESVRDEVVAEAKRLRSIGLPVLLAKPR